MKNNDRVTIREVYQLLQDVEQRLNERIDDIENNHLVHLNDKIDGLQQKVYFLLGGLAILEVGLQVLK